MKNSKLEIEELIARSKLTWSTPPNVEKSYKSERHEFFSDHLQEYSSCLSMDMETKGIIWNDKIFNEKGIMKSVLNFWKKDVINKLIVLVSIGVVVGAIIIGYLLLTMKSDSIFYEVFSPVLGKPDGVPTMAVSVTVDKPTETAFPIPTFTEFPSVEPARIELITDTPSVVIEIPTQALIQATATVLPASQVTVQSSVQASACIPDNPPQSGKVLDVIDGNTIKVLINDSAYTVRYIGIEVPRFRPTADYFGQEADFKNAEYVFAKEIILIADKVDKDDAGRLLRYVKSGDVFVNYELVKQGFASAIAGPAACASLFQDAELSAKQLKLGKWNPTPTPPSP